MVNLGSLFPDELQQPDPPKQQPARRNLLSSTSTQPHPQSTPQRSTQPSPPLQRICIRDLAPGQEVNGIYLVREASLRAAKNGSKYVQAAFADKTGQIPVRHWDVTEEQFKAYATGNYLQIRGRVETYQNRLQLIAFSAKAVDASEVDPGDFLPISRRPLAEMEREFDTLLASFTDPDFKRLLEGIFADRGIRDAFTHSVAAASIHHAWIHGLLEHVLSACATAEVIAQQRPFLNRDLLMAGVILHDIGKTEELDSGPGFSYTDTGKLLGHITLGALLVEREILKLPDFPKHKRDLILHLILSHHGTLEFGSPVIPCIPEAVALHHLECMDAKVQGMQSMIDADNESGNSGNWTEFARVADGRIYKGANQK